VDGKVCPPWLLTLGMVYVNLHLVAMCCLVVKNIHCSSSYSIFGGCRVKN